METSNIALLAVEKPIIIKKSRKRAGHSCQSCNKLKTKCDVSQIEGGVCSKCIKGNKTCIPMTSKRGKYDRSTMVNVINNTPTFLNDNCPEASTSKLSPTLSDNLYLGDLPDSNTSTSATSNSIQQQQQQQQNSPVQELPPQPEAGWINLFASSSRDRANSSQAGVLYVSELFTLAHLLRQNWEGTEQEDTSRVHFPGQSSAGAAQLNVNQIRYLTDTGCFTLPPKDVLDSIVESYFKNTHPIYPVINKREFMKQYENVMGGGVPLLILWAVLYVGSTGCDMAALTKAGFATRFLALQSFYSRAQALYSVGFEPDKVCIVQFQFLISQIWSGIEDSHFWAAKASSLAQSLGMHRSTVNSKFLDESTRRMWRRIFYCVYIRDKHSAAATGRPWCIVEDFCDVELPTEEDFEDGEDCDLFLRHISLAKIVGNIVLARLSSKVTDDVRLEMQSACYLELTEWHNTLPRRLTYDGSFKDIFVTFLHLSYHCWVIHLYRPKAGTKASSLIASESAATTVRLFEDLLQHGEILRTPQFGNTALFAAMGVVLQDRQIQGETNRRLSSHRLTIGMLAARELASARPVANWFGSLFTSLDTRRSSLNSPYKSACMTPVGDKPMTPAMSLDFGDSASFLDMFKGIDSYSYLDESGFPGLFNFDAMEMDEQKWLP